MVAVGVGHVLDHVPQQHEPQDPRRTRLLGRRLRLVVRASVRRRIRVLRHRFHRGVRDGQLGTLQLLCLPGHRLHVVPREQELARGAGRHSGAFQDIRIHFCHRALSPVHISVLQAMEFLHEFYKIPANQPNDTHVYAMKKDVGNGLWIPRLQSTLYYSKLWQTEIDAPQGSMDNAPALADKAYLFYGVSSLTACFDRCAGQAVSAVRALRTVRFDPTDESCRCFDDSLFQWKFDSVNDTDNQLWTRDGDSTAEWYEVKFCEFVRPDTVRTLIRTTHTHSSGRCSKTDMSTTRLCPQHGRTMVWSKSLQLPGQADGWCSGSPAGAGALTHTTSYILSLNITVF